MTNKRGAGRPKIAIVSTYDELCGIAGYTRALVKQLETVVDVHVFDLDQFLLRSPYLKIQQAGDKHIYEISDQLKNFDSVNIQLEHGTLGRDALRIFQRFKTLSNSAPSLSVTFHTVFRPASFPLGEILRELSAFKFGSAQALIQQPVSALTIGSPIYNHLKRLQKSKAVSAIVHTARDKKLFQLVYGIQNVFDHPLTFLSRDEAARVKQNANRASFPLLAALPHNARMFGVFGFLSPYKGFEIAVKALRLLPQDCHLLVFGGIHPQAIVRNETINGYLSDLINEAKLTPTVFDVIRNEMPQSTLNMTDQASTLFSEYPSSLAGRVHFMGVLPDQMFAEAMALCDAVVFPYQEVGQSSSGPIAIASDLGCNILASRTNAFMQYAKYNPESIQFFDIGNYAQLGTLMAQSYCPSDGVRKYNVETNRDMYLSAHPELRRSIAEVGVGA